MVAIMRRSLVRQIEHMFAFVTQDPVCLLVCVPASEAAFLPTGEPACLPASVPTCLPLYVRVRVPV